MTLGILQVLLGYLVCIFAFEELIFTEGQTRHEMIDQGRIQYQVCSQPFLKYNFHHSHIYSC